MIKQDFLRYYCRLHGGTTKKIIDCLESPGLHAVAFFRFNKWRLRQWRVVKYFFKPLSLYLQHRSKAKWGIEIQPGAMIGPGFIVFHYGGVFISSGVVIGTNCQVAHNVTIGVGSPGARSGCPHIGDNVQINAGSQVYGRIRIGNNVRIGPNAVVNTDVPDNAIVHHLPMRVVIFPNTQNPND
jgi:serine O-acetyltransferase